MSVADRIKARRLQLDMSQEELADKLGYKSKSSINKIELGRQNLTQSKIKAIADALDTTPGFIMGWEDSPAEPQESVEDEFVGFYGELKDKLTEEDLDDIKTLMRIRAEMRDKKV